MEGRLRITTTVAQKQNMNPGFVFAIWSIGIVLTGIVIFLTTNVGVYKDAFAASDLASTKTDGNWADGMIWEGKVTPTNWADNIVKINGNITLTSSTTAIEGFKLITLDNGKSFTSGTSSTLNNLSMQNVNFDVLNGDITIYGDLTLTSSTLTIASGSLTVTGVLSLKSDAHLTVAPGASVNASSLDISNNNVILDNNGSITIYGSVSQDIAVSSDSIKAMQGNGSLKFKSWFYK